MWSHYRLTFDNFCSVVKIIRHKRMSNTWNCQFFAEYLFFFNFRHKIFHVLVISTRLKDLVKLADKEFCWMCFFEETQQRKPEVVKFLLLCNFGCFCSAFLNRIPRLYYPKQINTFRTLRFFFYPSSTDFNLDIQKLQSSVTWNCLFCRNIFRCQGIGVCSRILR